MFYIIATIFGLTALVAISIAIDRVVATILNLTETIEELAKERREYND